LANIICSFDMRAVWAARNSGRLTMAAALTSAMFVRGIAIHMWCGLAPLRKLRLGERNPEPREEGFSLYG
jgi:hypothetical protein